MFLYYLKWIVLLSLSQRNSLLALLYREAGVDLCSCSLGIYLVESKWYWLCTGSSAIITAHCHKLREQKTVPKEIFQGLRTCLQPEREASENVTLCAVFIWIHVQFYYSVWNILTNVLQLSTDWETLIYYNKVHTILHLRASCMRVKTEYNFLINITVCLKYTMWRYTCI